MKTNQLVAFIASSIFIFAGFATIFLGSMCTAVDPKCGYPLWESISMLVVGIVGFAVGISGLVVSCCCID